MSVGVKAKPSWNGFSLKKKHDMPEGLWTRCPGCEDTLFVRSLEENMRVCPQCNHHFRVSARDRISYVCDADSFEEYFGDYMPVDALHFADRKTYRSRLNEHQKALGINDAVITGKGFIRGRAVILAVMDPDFIMGSMGSVVGEKIAAAAESAVDQQLPFVVISCSGGARMHEGILSLAQMAKTSAAIAKLDDAGGLFISVLTDPTMGGVTASFAMLGDVIIAEPGALIGFAGPRTIWHTIKIELPDGFQRAEFLQEHGYVDTIVERKYLRSELARVIDYCNC